MVGAFVVVELVLPLPLPLVLPLALELPLALPLTLELPLVLPLALALELELPLELPLPLVLPLALTLELVRVDGADDGASVGLVVGEMLGLAVGEAVGENSATLQMAVLFFASTHQGAILTFVHPTGHCQSPPPFPGPPGLKHALPCFGSELWSLHFVYGATPAHVETFGFEAHFQLFVSHLHCVVTGGDSTWRSVTRATASISPPFLLPFLLHFQVFLSQSQAHECSLKSSATLIVLEFAVTTRFSES